MKHALDRTSFLLSLKCSRTNLFDKTCIGNTELKIEIKNITIDRKTRWDGDGVVGGCLVGVGVDSNFKLF